MKHLLAIALLSYCGLSFAVTPVTPTDDDWNGSSVSDALIQKIQEASYQYKKCAADEMQKPAYANIDVRKATENVIKQCEPLLSKIRDGYLAEKVPATIADRHLKQLRTQTTRNLLAELMFREASKKAGQ